jgi:hypothetical protein
MQRLFKTIGVVSIVALILAAVAESSTQTSCSSSACLNVLNRERTAWYQDVFWLGYKIAFCVLTGPTEVVSCVSHDLDRFHPHDEGK